MGGLRRVNEVNSDYGEEMILVGRADPNGSIAAEEGTHFWDSVANKLYVNSDGRTTWIEIGAGGGGVTDHGALTGLADDDHPQYATDADLTTHAGAADPHTGYVLEAATPGGELGGTYAVPTVDATHSGSTHEAATDAHIADPIAAHSATAILVDDVAGDFTALTVEGVLAEIQTDNEAHVAAADPHAGYLKEEASGGTAAEVPDHTHVSAAEAGIIYSEVHYGFAPDALPTATVATGAPQGRYHLTGDVAETGIEVVTSCRVAGTSITLIIEIGSTNDADTATWATYKSVTLGLDVNGQIDTVTDSLTADRLLRLNVSSVSGVWSGITVDLRVKRPLRV